jgi:hypothetical protein
VNRRSSKGFIEAVLNEGCFKVRVFEWDGE